MPKKINFNINDFNLVLTIAGFAFITTFMPFIPSIPYRAFAFLIGLVALFKNHFRLPQKSIIFYIFFTILILIDLKTLLSIYIFDYQHGASYNDARLQCVSFVFGIALIPSLAVITGLRSINWKSTLWITCVILFFIIGYGILSMNQFSSDEIMYQRMELNDRQGTLQFGDNSTYLIIISLVLLTTIKLISKKYLRLLAIVFIGLCLIFGIIGVSKSASRGPFLAMLMGCFAIFLTIKNTKKIKIILVGICFILIGGVNMQSLEKFAPMLFFRMKQTVETHDLSGRELLYNDALQKIENSPFLGDNPVLLFPGAFSTCHNGYLVIALGLGVIGFLIFILINIILIVRVLNKKNYNYSVLYYFAVAMFFWTVMRSMSGADIIRNPMCILGIGLASILLSSSANKNIYKI